VIVPSTFSFCTTTSGSLINALLFPLNEAGALILIYFKLISISPVITKPKIQACSTLTQEIEILEVIK